MNKIVRKGLDGKASVIGFKAFMHIAFAIVGFALMSDTVLLAVLRVGSFNLGKIMPFIIGAPLFVVGVFHAPLERFFAKSQAGKVIGAILAGGMTVCYVAFILLFSVTTILINNAADESRHTGTNAEVVMVLGGGINGENVSLTLANRLDKAAKYLSQHTQAVCILSGGKGQDEQISEAEAMRRYMVNTAGISETRLILEDKSLSTYENFINSKAIIDARFPEGAVTLFVTTYFHVYRAELVAKTAGLNAKGIGALGVWYIAMNDYMRECAAITQYWLSGKI